MSGNPKSTSTGGQQPMRYAGSTYQTLQPSLQQTRDTYSIGAQSYVPQQANQGAGLRGISQAGPPPNQAPTPPNTDIKVQSVQQAQMYQNPGLNVRPNQNFIHRPPVSTNQTPRMQGQQHRGQHIYQPTQTPQIFPVPVYTLPYAHYGNANQRGSFVAQSPTVMLQGHPFAINPFAPNQNPSYQFTYQMPPRPGPPLQPTSTPSNQTSAVLPVMPMAQPMQQVVNKHQKKKRQYAVAIIDPTTGNNVMDETLDSHPPSGESSARQTPQPVNQINPSKDMQGFQAKPGSHSLINEDLSLYHEDDRQSVASSLDHHVDHQQIFQNENIQQAQYDHVIHTSNLKPHAREFTFTNAAHETPIVSANTDAEEITLPNKQKSKESPAKGRKSKDQFKEVAHKETIVNEKPKVKEEVITSLPSVPVVVQQSQPKEQPKDEKKSSKQKDGKYEAKEVTNVNENQISLPQAPQAAPVLLTGAEETPVNNNGKSKNSSRSKDVQQQKQNQYSSQNQKQQSLPQSQTVPTPKQPKAGNKTTKKAELNIKGAMKAGTEMDVFISDTVNANNTQQPETKTQAKTSAQLDAANANTIPVSNVTAAPQLNNTNVCQVPFNANVEEKGKADEIDATTVVAKPAEVAKAFPSTPMFIENAPSSTYDVTNVFKGGSDKMVKPYVPPPPSSSESNRDKTDQSAINKKIVQTKNEANAKNSGDPAKTANAITFNSLNYEDGNWSPNNIDGKKKYGKELLLQLRELPNSKVKPANIPDAVILDDRQRTLDSRPSLGSKQDFMGYPGFGKIPNQGRGGVPSLSKRGSSSKASGKGKSTNGATNKISISLREDVKLHESENAWKPAHLTKKDGLDKEAKKTEELYKAVRGVLNKLTPQKFDTLVGKVKELQIDTDDRLKGVIDLIYEKAVDEPNFSVAYAKMCNEVSLSMQLQGQLNDSTVPNKSNGNIFRKMLIGRCQDEFEKQSRDESKRAEKLQEILECTDPEKKKDLEFELEEYDRRIRMRSVGNVRFIGELFKIGMLTTKIMMQCLEMLLKTCDEESLECLCKLLSTIGKELEKNDGQIEKHKALANCFNTMQDIANKKQVKCSSRIRFMLQDVIDLRKNNWVPRRQDLNPKTMDQIQREAENEQLNQAIVNSTATPRKEDNRPGGSSSMNKSRAKTEEGGWSTPSARSNRTSYTISADKMKVKQEDNINFLGSANTFMIWGAGSRGTSTNNLPIITNQNKYAALAVDKTSSLSPSYERNLDGRNSRSGSQQRTKEWARETTSLGPQVPAAKPAPITVAPTPQPAVSIKSKEELIRSVKNSLEEFINDNCTFEEYENEIIAQVPPGYFMDLVVESYQAVIDKKGVNYRIKTGVLFAKLIKAETLPLKVYCSGLEELFSQVEDLLLDIPTLWTALAECIAPLVYEEVLPLIKLHQCMQDTLNYKYAQNFLAPLFKLIIREKGQDFLSSLWQLSEFELTDFMAEGDINKFVEENGFQFLVAKDKSADHAEFTYDQIEKKLTEFFLIEKPFDNINAWIKANVGDRVHSFQFIRTLTRAILKHSIVKKKLVVERLKNHYKFFQKYVDNHSNFELQSLYAIQSLLGELEHPPGLLLSIFNELSEDLIFSKESFLAWEASVDPAEQAGKGVATKQLTCFFTQLKENEDDFGSSDCEEGV